MADVAPSDVCLKKQPINSAISRKRYNEILRQIKEHGYEQSVVEDIGNILRNVFSFDPDGRVQSKYMMNRIYKRADELGVSTYVTSGRKDSYWRMKEQKNIGT